MLDTIESIDRQISQSANGLISIELINWSIAYRRATFWFQQFAVQINKKNIATVSFCWTFSIKRLGYCSSETVSSEIVCKQRTDLSIDQSLRAEVNNGYLIPIKHT